MNRIVTKQTEKPEIRNTSDALNEILAAIRLSASVYFQRDFSAPWAMEITGTGFAQFHIVTRGVCVVEFSGERIELSAGDILLFPHGTGHVLADEPDRTPIAGPDVMASFETDKPHFVSDGRATRVICGHYQYRMRPAHPLIEGLPDVIHLKSGFGGSRNSIKQILDLIIEETRQEGPGHEVVARRLAEVLLIYVLRAYTRSNAGHTGLVAAITDRRLSRVVVQIQRDYEKPLSLSDLARTAGMSRSGFAREFRLKTGLTPIDYLTKWRLYSAGDLLIDHDLPIAEVAAKTGYNSDIAFSRAFKREYGISPSRYRRQ